MGAGCFPVEKPNVQVGGLLTEFSWLLRRIGGGVPIALNPGWDIGMDFDAAPAGLVSRSKRYAMLVDDGKVTLWQPEEVAGTCETSGGESLLANM